MSVVPYRQESLFDQVLARIAEQEPIADELGDLSDEQWFAPFPLVARLSKTCECLRGPVVDSKADDRDHCVRCGRPT